MHSNKPSKFKCNINYIHNNDNIVIMNAFSTIDGATIVVGFFLDVIYFAIQVVDESPLNIAMSIELGVNIVEIARLTSYLGVQLSFLLAVGCSTQLKHNVCGVFYYFFVFFVLNFFGLYLLHC